MAIEFAFLETIGGRSALNPDIAPPSSLAEAVRENLVLLLNTRRGSVPHLPDFGLPDVSEVYKDKPDPRKLLAQALQDTIQRYEPRLKQIDISILDQPGYKFEADYAIKGLLETPDGSIETVTFTTVVPTNGRVEVRV